MAVRFSEVRSLDHGVPNVRGGRPSHHAPGTRTFKGVANHHVRGQLLIDLEDRRYSCPECRKEFKTPELLAPHLERHREVGVAIKDKKGTSRSSGCPRGCGRHFAFVKNERPSHEFREHIMLCKGDKPL